MSELPIQLFLTGFAKSGTTLLANLLGAQPHFTIRSDGIAAPLGAAAEVGGFHRELPPHLRNRALAMHRQSLVVHGLETRIRPGDFRTAGELYARALAEIARPDDLVVGHKLTAFGPHTAVFDALLRETEVRCVCILRDVRDVVLSQKNSLLGSAVDPDTWLAFARRSRELDGHPRVAVVRYETLVEDPERALAPIARLLGMPIAHDLERSTLRGRPWRDNSSFHDVEQTFDRRPVGRWREATADPSVRFAAWWCADELARSGYPKFGEPFSWQERVRFARARAVRAFWRRASPIAQAARRLRNP